MAERKDEVLNSIVEEYIKTAVPVSSSLIVEKYFTDLSSATVRNDMSELEEMGLIFQPHTSAGRIPTVNGYKRYLKSINIDDWYDVPLKIKKGINEVLGFEEHDIKVMAKLLAEMSGGAILIGFSPMNVYYTGISNIFRQPEFREQSIIFSISEIIDHLDEVMNLIFHQVDDNLKIFLGDDNPFGELTSAVAVKCQVKKNDILVGILGPNRMDYKQNVSLLKYIQKTINENNAK
ncbi:MAG: hypothetical protein WCV92_02230 [Candidatus Buchananbacteria bacterium]